MPTNGALAEKKEERSRPKYDPRLSCARGAVWISARSEIRATIRTTQIYRRWRRRRPRPRAAARVIYASTSIGVEVERPSRTREGEKERGGRKKERERERARERSDRARSGLTSHSSGLGSTSDYEELWMHHHSSRHSRTVESYPLILRSVKLKERRFLRSQRTITLIDERTSPIRRY